jgi:hypothetical protein
MPRTWWRRWRWAGAPLSLHRLPTLELALQAASSPGSSRQAQAPTAIAPLPLPTSPQGALLCGFDFLAVPLAHPRYRRPAAQRQPSDLMMPPFTRSDYLLSASQWSGQVRERRRGTSRRP